MICAGCKHLDTKKRVAGAVSGARYYCKKTKKYVGGDFCCSKFEKSYRDIDDYNKIYHEGREWDNDKTSPMTYFIIGVILLIVTIIMFLIHPELY